jgi:hypothetical protein
MNKCSFNPHPLFESGKTIDEINAIYDEKFSADVELVSMQYDVDAIPDSYWSEIINPILGSYEYMGR